MTFWCIIVNPAAAGGAVGRNWPQLQRALQRSGISYSVRFTQHRGHAVRLVDDAVLHGYRHFLGIGGDGTNHEIANGILYQTHTPAKNISYALLPVGTGNDWARAYNIPTDPDQRLKRLQHPQTRLQDVGEVSYRKDRNIYHRFFVNVAGMAYDAYLAEQLEKHPHKPGKFLYLGLVMRHLFDYRLRPARIRFNNQTVEDLFYTINVGICPYSGGGMRLVPHAVPDDGLLALTFARQVGKWEVVLQTRRFYNGTLLDHPKIEGCQTEGPITVEPIGELPTLLEADGEFLGEAPATFNIRKNALKIVL